MSQKNVSTLLDLTVTEHHLAHVSGLSVLSRPSPNCRGELVKPRVLLMHYTAGRGFEQSIAWLCRKPKGVDKGSSAHVVIGREGEVAQLVPFNVRAWHAGESAWTFPAKPGVVEFDSTIKGLNAHSIGIELDNPGKLQRRAGGWFTIFGTEVADEDVVLDAAGQGWHAFPAVQIQAAYEVCETIIDAYPTIDTVLGHSEVSPGRKSDPGAAFPLETFRSWLLGRGEG